MFHIADPHFYEAVKREADAADLVLVEGIYAMGNEWIENEKRRMVQLLRPLWLAPQITALEPGSNARVVEGDAEALMKTLGNGGSLLPSVENLLRRYHSERIETNRRRDLSRPDWDGLPTAESRERGHPNRSQKAEYETRGQLARTAKEAVVSLAGNRDFVDRRNNLLVDEVARALAGAKGASPPGKLVILYGAAHAPGILECLAKRLGYKRDGKPGWMNVWVYRHNLRGGLLPHKAKFSLEIRRDALLVLHRKELWQCYFSDARGGGVNVSAVYYQLRKGKWRRRQITGPAEGESGADRDVPVTYEAPLHFLQGKDSPFTPVMFKSVDTTCILFHAVKNKKEIAIHLDPAELPDGTPLSAEYAVFPGGGVPPIPPQPEFLLGPEYVFSRRP
ncbi:MAG: hypothetical protein E3J72_01975 [Planctomycetota bacterium]|nr:MAG: hypothetical protein E3J72_01975 [Planctomycetota bacterium]